jgi:hypothetical protein
MKHCPTISENGGPCANAHLANCPELGKPGKCRTVGIDEVIEAVQTEKPKKKKKDDAELPTA